MGIITELVDSVVNEFVPTGILIKEYDDGWEQYLTHSDGHFQEPPLIFSLGNLDAGFVVWLGACCVCTIVFIFEMISTTLKRWSRKLIRCVTGCVLFLMLLRQRMRAYHDEW
jgi:hypothetical protein